MSTPFLPLIQVMEWEHSLFEEGDSSFVSYARSVRSRQVQQLVDVYISTAKQRHNDIAKLLKLRILNVISEVHRASPPPPFARPTFSGARSVGRSFLPSVPPRYRSVPSVLPSVLPSVGRSRRLFDPDFDDRPTSPPISRQHFVRPWVTIEELARAEELEGVDFQSTDYTGYTIPFNQPNNRDAEHLRNLRELFDNDVEADDATYRI